ncbi:MULTISPECIES: protein phosphatase 2C domain-containing protein [Aerosakkonema]|uniref:protein phosphatase 2C domain-containing protein n=1 Tax=Aerosakkonema TaxID=1246629 RepID=UPI0035B71644
MSSSEPPFHRYLWASDPASALLGTGELVQGRYQVVAPQIWLDTQPELPPEVPQELPEEIFPYLRLFPLRLHIPEVYGLVVMGEPPDTTKVTLLENAPIDEDGNLYPHIVEAWERVNPVRRVYWLSQILELWTPLSEFGVVSSLLMPENVRVQGWRVWLLELYADTSHLQEAASLQDLGECWIDWIGTATDPVSDRLREIGQQMRSGEVELEEIAAQINRLLLEEAAQLPLRLQVAGATDVGPMRKSNEDSCYPTNVDIENRHNPPNDRLIPYLTLVCDGIGGHEGGEVASDMALQTLKLQVRALLMEVSEQTEIVPPKLVLDQLTAIVRVVNNMISSQNDAQGRELRQRMGTTLVMALQLPQKIVTADGKELGNAHELYIASVGDSRVYWISADYCQQLTVDDDVATREVRMGRSLYREALKRVDGGALTQALGMRDAEVLRPTVRRFIVEEDGLLLLCSDGLSDRSWVEKSWKDYAKPILKGRLSLEAGVEFLIDLANEKNGHDNTSVVITCCLLSPEAPVLFDPRKAEPDTSGLDDTAPMEWELTEASKALLYADSATAPDDEPVTIGTRQPQTWVAVLGVVALLIFGLAAYGAWRTLNSQNSQPQAPTQEESL